MFKSKASKNDTEAALNVAEVVRSEVGTLEQHSGVEPVAPRAEPATHPGTRSCIGSGMVIVGNIECNGPAQVFGRIQGEVRASDLLIGDGAQVEGSVIAQDVTVCGQVKGTIRAVRVKLQNGGAVEGDIFIGRCRSTRILSLKDHRGGLRIQWMLHRSAQTARRKRRSVARSWPPICRAKHRQPLTGLKGRLSRSIRTCIPNGAQDCTVQRMRAAMSGYCDTGSTDTGSTVSTTGRRLFEWSGALSDLRTLKNPSDDPAISDLITAELEEAHTRLLGMIRVAGEDR